MLEIDRSRMIERAVESSMVLTEVDIVRCDSGSKSWSVALVTEYGVRSTAHRSSVASQMSRMILSNDTRTIGFLICSFCTVLANISLLAKQDATAGLRRTIF